MGNKSSIAGGVNGRVGSPDGGRNKAMSDPSREPLRFSHGDLAMWDVVCSCNTLVQALAKQEIRRDDLGELLEVMRATIAIVEARQTAN